MSFSEITYSLRFYVLALESFLAPKDVRKIQDLDKMNMKQHTSFNAGQHSSYDSFVKISHALDRYIHNISFRPKVRLGSISHISVPKLTF